MELGCDSEGCQTIIANPAGRECTYDYFSDTRRIHFVPTFGSEFHHLVINALSEGALSEKGIGLKAHGQ